MEYKLKENEGIYLNDINENKACLPISRVAKTSVFKVLESNNQTL